MARALRHSITPLYLNLLSDCTVLIGLAAASGWLSAANLSSEKAGRFGWNRRKEKGPVSALLFPPLRELQRDCLDSFRNSLNRSRACGNLSPMAAKPSRKWDGASKQSPGATGLCRLKTGCCHSVQHQSP